MVLAGSLIIPDTMRCGVLSSFIGFTRVEGKTNTLHRVKTDTRILHRITSRKQYPLPTCGHSLTVTFSERNMDTYEILRSLLTSVVTHRCHDTAIIKLQVL